MNGVGFSETVPVCEVCPLNSYADTVGSPVCSQCPKYHTTSFTGATSLQDCSREFRLVLSLDSPIYMTLKLDFDVHNGSPKECLYQMKRVVNELKRSLTHAERGVACMHM